MMFKTAALTLGLLGLTTIAHANETCAYETKDGYAHVVSIPDHVIVSISGKYPNVRLNPDQFPKDVEPAQVYQVSIKERTKGDCSPVAFTIGKRLK